MVWNFGSDPVYFESGSDSPRGENLEIKVDEKLISSISLEAFLEKISRSLKNLSPNRSLKIYGFLEITQQRCIVSQVQKELVDEILYPFSHLSNEKTREYIITRQV